MKTLQQAQQQITTVVRWMREWELGTYNIRAWDRQTITMEHVKMSEIEKFLYEI